MYYNLFHFCMFLVARVLHSYCKKYLNFWSNILLIHFSKNPHAAIHSNKRNIFDSIGSRSRTQKKKKHFYLSQELYSTPVLLQKSFFFPFKPRKTYNPFDHEIRELELYSSFYSKIILYFYSISDHNQEQNLYSIGLRSITRISRKKKNISISIYASETALLSFII